MKKLHKTYGCPVEPSLDVLGGKWKSVILARLKDAPLSYGELRRLIPDLSEKILSERLATLSEHNLVKRSASAGTPARHRYHLTEHGKSLRPVLEALYRWGERAATRLDIDFR